MSEFIGTASHIRTAVTLARQLHDVVVHAVQIEPAREAAAALGFERQHFSPRDVDEIHTGSVDQQVLLCRVIGIDTLQHPLNVIDRAEEYGAADAHDLELRTVRQAASRREKVAVLSGIGFHVHDARPGGAARSAEGTC